MEYASQIIVADNVILQDFVRVLRQPEGNIVMADRAALAAEEAMQNLDGSNEWSRYVESRFIKAEGKWSVVPERKGELAEYTADVTQSLTHIGEIQQVLTETASKLNDQHELAPALRRFLEHEGTATHIYASELRRRMRPGADEIIERFDNLFVKVDNGYLIRPTRRGQAAQVFVWLDQSRGALQRLQKELNAWSDDLVKTDEQHRDFATTLRSPAFAMFLLLDHADGEGALDDEQLSNIFYVLEDATRDTAAGLVLDTDSGEYQEMREEMNRFEGAWNYRESLMKELSKFAGQVVDEDDLHRRWKKFLSSEAAFLYVVRNADYIPVDAVSACREMLSGLLTRNEEGKYDITVESSEDLTNQIEDYYRQFREIRRRGRVIDDFAGDVSDSSLAAALKPMIGKMLLFDLVKTAVPPTDVDGLALWFESRFEETPEGLKLYDWASEEIASVVSDAAELEGELSKQDF